MVGGGGAGPGWLSSSSRTFLDNVGENPKNPKILNGHNLTHMGDLAAKPPSNEPEFRCGGRGFGTLFRLFSLKK